MSTPTNKRFWLDCVDWDVVEDRGLLTEDDCWEAIAEATGQDYSEIADGDLLEWL